MKINSLKETLDVETSEELFAIPKQPDQQCPLINDIISDLNTEAANVKSVWQGLKDVEEAQYYISDLDWAEFNIRNLDSKMEEVRTNIENIRSWGEEWKSLAMELLQDKEDLTNFIASEHQVKLELLEK